MALLTRRRSGSGGVTAKPSARVLAELGHVYIESGEMEEARKCFDKALLVDERTGAAWTGKATVLEMQGEHHAALGLYKKAIMLTRETPEVRVKQAECFWKMGMMEDLASEVGEIRKEFTKKKSRMSRQERNIEKKLCVMEQVTQEFQQLIERYRIIVLQQPLIRILLMKV